MLTVFVKRLNPDAIIPVKATPGAACYDLFSNGVETEWNGYTVNTGIAVELPPRCVMLVYPRSGLSSRIGLSLRNGTGVIDSDYRGEILLKFHSAHAGYENDAYRVLAKGNRVAQALIIPVPLVNLSEVEELGFTDRGTGGFGSTGS